MPDRKGSIGTAVAWMFLISILLFWLPIFGPLVADLLAARSRAEWGRPSLRCSLQPSSSR